MRQILVAGLHHESNTFNPIITGIEDFTIYRGEEILSVMNKRDSISGVIETLMGAGEYEVVPLLMARAVPNGVIDRELYLSLKTELLSMMRDYPDADAITLSLHGSMRIQGLGEAEGDLLEAIRELFPSIPILSSLDMHATVTERMLSHCDGFVGYKQAPHTDCYETGAHAARLTLRALEPGVKLHTGWCRVPMLIAGEKSETSVEPMRSMIENLRETERRDGILAASYLLGFPWADAAENSVCALVVTEEDRELAERTALELGTGFWDKRHDFVFHTTTLNPVAALEKALEHKKGPVYLSDSGDNPTAGSSADCTGFLKLVLEHEGATSLDPPLLYAGIYDPRAVAACRNHEGEVLVLQVGALFDTKTSRPLTLTATVKEITEHYGSFDATLVLLQTQGIDLILTDKHIGFTETEMFDALDIDYMKRKVIVVKLGYLTASHKEAASAAIMALTDGSSNECLPSLGYAEVTRPIFPLDTVIDGPLTAFSL